MGVVAVKNCDGNDVCIATATPGSFGSGGFSVSVYVGGNNLIRGTDPGPGGSASVTFEESAITDGPVRPGFITFTYGPTALNASGGATAEAAFSVGEIQGTVPGQVGIPMPAAGVPVPFGLGVAFAIQISASFSVPSGPPSRYANAQVNLSFSLFEAESLTLADGSVSQYPGAPVAVRANVIASGAG
ncbi:MAG TPA: hypothetical protein VGG72_36235 [Bryobacteraceae bacterium]|jgi:hypothetical protein